MLTMFKKNHNVFVPIILLLVSNLLRCRGNYTCYQMSSGKDICFMFDGTKRTLEESKQFCQNIGGFLLEIYNIETQTLVEKFVINKTSSLEEAWLNLVRTNSNVWVWGGSNKILNYSNWEGVIPGSYEGSFNHAFMNSNYKWMNSYDPKNAKTICFKENKITYPTETSTTSPTTTTTQEPPGTPKEDAKKSSSTTSKSTSPSSTTTTTTTTVSSLYSQISLPSPSSSSTTTTTSMKLNHATSANSESSPSSSASLIGIGVGVGLGGLVLIIVSSLLIAKFVCHKEIPLPFTSSRNRNSPPHQIGSDVTNGGYVKMDKNNLDERSAYAEVMMSDTPNLPPNSTLNYVGFQDMIQPNSASGLEGLSKADYETSQTFGKNIYDNAV